MANKKFSELPLYTGDTVGAYFIMNDSGETTTYKVIRETILGESQTSGTSGTSGINGSSGTSGVNGTNGSSGSSGTSGIGVNGTSGSNGSSGTSGSNGLSGSSGSSGISGTSGSSGVNGQNGSSGTSGIDGLSGSSGTSGINGNDGSSGTSGVSGTSGTSGTSVLTTVTGTTSTGDLNVGGNQTVTGSATFSGPFTISNGVGLGGSSEGGEINLAYAQNTTLTGSMVVLDVYNDRVRIFESGGNNRGVHIDLSKTPGGVAGELMWKASGFVNAGTFVTLDNLKCTVTTSGQRGLSIGAVSGSFEADLSGWYGGQSIGTAGGAANNLGYNTTASTSLFGWSFPAHGDTAQYQIRDKTNNRFYRVTMMIGVSYISNFISIERLF